MAALRPVALLSLAAIVATGCGRDALTFGSSPTAQLRVEPTTLELYRGQTFSVDVVYGTTSETRSVLGEEGLSLSAAPAEVLSVSTDGTGLAGAAGDAVISAVFEGLDAQATATVLDATLVGLKVEPPSVVVAVDGTQALEVIGELSDGSTIDLTAGATGTIYDAGPETVVAVSADGVVTGVGAGQGVVQITQGALSVDVSVEVTADPNAFVALRIEPNPIVLGRFEGVEFRVFGTRATGEDVDVIDEGLPVELSVGDPNLVRVSPGFVESLGAPGTTELQARLAPLVASATVEVQDGMRELVGLAVQPEFLTLAQGERAQLEVTGFYSDGSSENLSAASAGTTYATDAPGVVSVDVNGGVIADGAGGTLIIVRNQGFEAFTFVEVRGDRELIALEVQPPDIRLDLNQQVQLTVLAFYSDGFVEDVTPQASYTPPISGIADVSPTGLVRARAAGEDAIFVGFQTLSVVVPIRVDSTMNPVVEVRVTPALVQVPLAQPFFGLDVVAIFADGSQASVLTDPNLVITTDDPAIALWDGVAVVGLATGQTVLRATFQGVTGTARVQVTGTTSILLGIQLSAPGQVAVGQTQPVGVFAFYSDGSIVDVSLDPQLMLSSDNTMVLTAGMSTVTGVSAGVTTLRAFFLGEQASAPVTVTPNVDPVISIAWQPASVTVNVGATSRARIVGTRQSGATQDLSNDPGLTLATTGPISVATVPGAVAITGNTAGNGSVLATYQGLSATLPVTVQSTGPTLDGLQIVAPGQLRVNTTGMFAVVAFFSDGTFVDVTNDPQLMLTATPAIVTFGPSTVIAQQVGTTQISATYLTASSQVTLVVTAGNDTVTGLTFQPASLSIPVNQRRSFVLIATFSSGATVDVTFDPLVTYGFNGPILPTPGPNGIELLGQMAGSGSVTASYRGRNATLPVTVTSSGPSVTRIILTAPANLDLGSNGSYTVTAEFSDGSSTDVTNDPGLMVFVENPAIFSAAGGVLTPLTVGTTRLGVTFSGFSAQRTINVVNNNPFTSIRFQPTSLSLTVGQSATVQVIGRRSNGATENVTAQVVFTATGPISLGPAATDLPVLANAPGSGSVQASFNGLNATLPVTIMGLVPPTITGLVPNAVLVGSPTTVLLVNGTLFQSGDTVVIDGTPVPTVFTSGTQLRASLAPTFFTAIADLDVQVIGTRGPSNTVVLPVGQAPNVTSYAPNTVIAGSATDVVAIGTGLTSLTVSALGLSTVLLSNAPDGTLARIRVTASASLMPGPYTVTLTNPWGSTTITMTVAPATGQMDLVVASGQTLQLSGTNVFNNVTVNTGGRILGIGTAPLALIATGNITLRGSIDVSGADGLAGFTGPAAGGAAGPGGGGGGGGGDGDTSSPAPGGAGSPPGSNAGAASNAGTPAGDGGGAGAGVGGAGGCGQGGGGGALGGNGGAAGGDQGIGTGGAGGVASSGSQFGAGTGGGGGSTCGPNSGGGGGGGGGALILQVALGGTISIEGAINANGGDGGFGFSGTGGGGGGSGGLVEVTAPGGTITLIDTIFARGGAGGDADFGDGGGGGGGGRIILDASPGGTVTTTLGIFDVTGGTQGLPLGTGFAGRGGDPGTSSTTP